MPRNKTVIDSSSHMLILSLAPSDVPRRYYQRGYRVAAYASAGEALQSLRDQDVGSPPDLIITDVNMPGINGFRFLEALRSGGRPERSIPVVFLTARGLTMDRIEASDIQVKS